MRTARLFSLIFNIFGGNIWFVQEGEFVGKQVIG